MRFELLGLKLFWRATLTWKIEMTWGKLSSPSVWWVCNFRYSDVEIVVSQIIDAGGAKCWWLHTPAVVQRSVKTVFNCDLNPLKLKPGVFNLWQWVAKFQWVYYHCKHFWKSPKCMKCNKNMFQSVDYQTTVNNSKKVVNTVRRQHFTNSHHWLHLWEK